MSSGGCYTDITPRERVLFNVKRSLRSFFVLHTYIHPCIHTNTSFKFEIYRVAKELMYSRK